MNKTPQDATETKDKLPTVKFRHPYTLSNSTDETIRRMKGFPERAAKFLEKLNADRKKNSR
jgi:hypothetical protein